MQQPILVNTDGANRGNPGQGAWAAVVQLSLADYKMVRSGFLENVTNNDAEYAGLINALDWLLELSETSRFNKVNTKIHIRMDSELVVKQILGEYQVGEKLMPHWMEAIERYDALSSIAEVHIIHIPRTQNYIADAACRTTMDENGAVAPKREKKKKEPAEEDVKPEPKQLELV